MPLQASAPLVEALQACVERSHTAFYTPGHKQGQGISPLLKNLLGAAVFRADLPELPELDNLFAPQAAIQAAQQLAADLFGAEQTWFLANGSTCGIEAAILATCQPGDKIILPRTVHQSAIAALILSGTVPVFVAPDYDAANDLAHCISAAAVATALQQHPEARAILMVSPTYYGVCGAVEAIAHLAHQHHIPLIIDEAHGPHFAFHAELPLPALAAGADVVVQSTHKVLSAMTQAAMLHVQGDRVDACRIRQALQLVQSTSPSYLLLASLDAARQQMAQQGTRLMTQTLHLADQARQQLSQIAGLAVLSPDQAGTPGFTALDRTRLTVDVTGLGLTGFDADQILHQQLGVTAELPTFRHLTFIVTLGNTAADIERLVWAFHHLRPTGKVAEITATPSLAAIAPLAPLTPRAAFFAPAEVVALEQACDRISVELICPYPPGIPVVLPGERLTRANLNYLQHILAAGGFITGCADPSLQTLRVVKAEE